MVREKRGRSHGIQDNQGLPTVVFSVSDWEQRIRGWTKGAFEIVRQVLEFSMRYPIDDLQRYFQHFAVICIRQR